MIYLRRLAHLFQHQHLTMTGAIDGKRVIIMTDRRLTLVEKQGPSEDEEMRYIDSFSKESLNPMDMLETLDDDGCPVIPVPPPMVPAGEDTENGGKGKVIPPKKTWGLINTTIAGTYPFALPSGIELCKDEWLAFRFNGGKLYIRSANKYEDLLKSTEVVFDVEYNDEVEDDTCFAVRTELIRVCRELADDKVVISVKKNKETNSTYIGIRTPDLTCVFFGPPLILEENLKVAATKEESPDSPENQETEADVVSGNEEVEETEVVEPEEAAEGSEVEEQETEAAEEETAEEAENIGEEVVDDANDAEETEETEETEEVETAESNEGEAPEAPKPAAEDVDPLEAYDTLIPDLIKSIQETVKEQGNEAKRILKNATKQSRRALRSKSDPEDLAKLKAENAALKKKLSVAEHQRDVAKKALKEIL